MADAHALNLIQEEKFQQFNAFVEGHSGAVDLTNAHFRGYDMRKCNLKTANLSGAYMRHADLRGLDLSEAVLEGASMKEAHISGTLFPRNISAQEIMLSVTHGTRIRTDM